MPDWTPQLEWKDQDAFVIGGGPSLRGFDFNRLEGKHTIGCNSAFLLGSRIVEVCFFSDPQWFEKYYNQLCQFGGRIVTHCGEVPGYHPWVFRMDRFDDGLHRNGLGFGGNTGCGAVNLALLLGARRVYLLGFDMKLNSEQRMNWHDERCEPVNSDPALFEKFIAGFKAVSEQLFKFSGCEVINLGPDSALPFFPRANLEDVL